MPKTLIHPLENVKRVHPLRYGYAKLSMVLSEKRQQILAGTGWSYRTFYNKLEKDDKLTETEATVIAAVLEIPINSIEAYQGGFKNSKQ